MGSDRQIRGHRLHIEEFGSPTSKHVLFLHGGPGMGSYHFELVQGPRLGEALHLITLDQRGVLRSDPIADGEPFGIADLIADFEALRRELGIERWSLIGHSFGGYLAAVYASAHPAAVDRLVLDNASLDLASSSRSLLTAAGFLYAAELDAANARECLALAHAPSDAAPSHLWEQLTRHLQGLGPRRDDLYIHGPRKRLVDDLTAAAPFPPEFWQRGATHQARLVQEGALFKPLVGPVLHRKLLIKGRYDLVFAADQIAGLLAADPETKLLLFEESGHFAHLEEPDRFATEVISFLAPHASGTERR